VILETVDKNEDGKHCRDEVWMDDIKSDQFTLDIGHTHVVEARGKPHGSNVHFLATTTEPHGVCCLQGLKVSLGMHNFGKHGILLEQ
jgi:hypothetical protein